MLDIVNFPGSHTSEKFLKCGIVFGDYDIDCNAMQGRIFMATGNGAKFFLSCVST